MFENDGCKEYSGAEIIMKLLELRGIEQIAGMPGGANLPLYDALYKSSIQHILIRHEQAAGFIAQGMARTTGKAAVCFATSGPGAMNLLTAIADAKLDSIPIVAITGQVPVSLVGTDAFQEVDTFGMTMPIVKHNYFVHSVEELLEVIPKAFRIAEGDRPGPVLIDVPKDVQNAKMWVASWPSFMQQEDLSPIEEESIKKAAEIINGSQRPVLYIGGGIVHGGAHKILLEFAHKNSIPIASTLMGLGAVPVDEPLYLGMLGMHGARYTNMILKEADALLAFGVRFDDRATGKVSEFCPEAKVIHIDIDASEINKIRRADLSIIGDIKTALEKMLEDLEPNTRKEWLDFVSKMKKEYPHGRPSSEAFYHPINVIQNVSELVPADTIVATDVGQHQMWVAQIYPFQKPRTLLTSGGLGTMGFGFPTAIGAALANPHRRVVCFSGDGSFLMNIQELATLADLQLDVKIIIMNNGYLGLVRQQQEMFYNQQYMASQFTTNPDFAAIAKGFGIAGYDLRGAENPMVILQEALTRPGPCLIDIPILPVENVTPIVPPGKGNHVMIGE